jgi:hypothetical protein
MTISSVNKENDPAYSMQPGSQVRSRIELVCATISVKISVAAYQTHPVRNPRMAGGATRCQYSDRISVRDPQISDWYKGTWSSSYFSHQKFKKNRHTTMDKDPIASPATRRPPIKKPTFFAPVWSEHPRTATSDPIWFVIEVRWRTGWLS